MKRILLFIGLFCAYFSVNAQLLTEDFNFTTATTSNGWTQLLTTTTNPLIPTTANLTYINYGSATTGQSLLVLPTGQDVSRGGWTNIGAGNLFLSALINMPDSAMNATGDYFLGFYANGAARARIFARRVSGGFNIGVAKGSTTPVYASTLYATNTTHLLVLKYTFVSGTTTDDSVSLFMNPVINGVENNQVVANMNDAGTDLNTTNAQSVVIRQGGGYGVAPTIVVDAIKVATAWADILSPPNTNYYYKGTGALNTLSNWGTNTDGSGTAPSSFASASQTFNIVNTTSVALSGSWLVSGANSKIVVPIADTLKVTGGATIGNSTIDVAGALTLDNFSFPTWGTNVSGSILIDNPAGINVGGAAIITLPNFASGGEFVIVSGDVNMGDNDVIVAGRLQINGSFKMSGTGNFELRSTGTLRIGHPQGIVTSSTSNTGAIQFGTSRTFDPAASYTYLGTGSNLETGTGLPANLTGTLSIRLANTTDVITLTQSITGNTGTAAYPTVSMLKGLLKIGNNNITLSSMINGYAGSYVITNGTGTISRPVANTGGSSTTAKSFYVGSETEYRLLRITFPSTIGTPTTTNIVVRYVASNPGSTGYPTGIETHSPNGYWNLGFSVAPTNTYTLDVETNGMAGATSLAGAKIIRRVAGANASWDSTGTGATNSFSGTTLSSTLVTPPTTATTYDIALGLPSTVLPVKFLGVAASKLASSVKVEWSTANEINNSHFVIQRSANGIAFENIGIVNALPNSTMINNYEFVDATPLSATAYYRIQQVDVSNQFAYSPIITVASLNIRANTFSIAPNPIVSGTATVVFNTVAGGQFELYLQSTQGTILYSKRFQQNAGTRSAVTLQLPSGLAKGMYVVKLVDVKTQSISTQKVLIN